jgi:signal peptidase I
LLSKEKPEASEYVKVGAPLSLNGEACVDIIISALAKKVCLRLQVKGFSMSPFIQDGDIITLSPLPGGSIGLGRSIAYIRPCDKKLVIHRLVRTYKGPPEIFFTQGDSAAHPDSPITRIDMLAVVRKVERGGRTVLLGTGPECRAIAYASRLKILWALSIFWKVLVPRSISRKIKKYLIF